MKRLVRVGIATSYVLFLTFIICVSIAHFVHYIGQDSLGAIDFVNHYMAGRMTISSDAHQIYDPATQLRWFRTLVPTWHQDKPFYCQFMPFFFPMMVPLALVPLKTAFVAWLIFSLSFGLGGLFFFLRSHSALSKTQICWVLIATSLSFPAIICLSIGQTGFLLVGLFSLFFLFLQRKKYIPAALALALTSYKPHYTLFFAMPGLAQRRWKLIAWLVIFELLLVALAGLTVGWHNVFSYPAILKHAETTSDYIGVHGYNMVSVRGILSRLTVESVAVPLSFMAMLAGAAGTYLIWLREAPVSSPKQRWAIALTVLLCLSTSPHTHLHDLVMLTMLTVTLPTIDITELILLRPLTRLLWYLLIYLYPAISWGSAVLWVQSQAASIVSFIVINLVLLACGVQLFIAVGEQAERETQSEKS